MSSLLLVLLSMSQKLQIPPEKSPLENCLDSKPLNISNSDLVEKYTISNSAQNWFGAVDCCNYHGLRLATVQNEQDWHNLTQLAESSPAFNATESNVWIGASNLADGGGDHVWQATGERVTFSKWLDNESRDGAKHCVQMRYRPEQPEWHWNWRLESCERKLYFACEMVVKMYSAELVEV